MNTTTLKTRLEGLGPEKELLCLIIGIFAVGAATALMNSIVNICHITFCPTSEGSSTPIAVTALKLIIRAISKICYLGIYIRLVTNKALPVNKKARIGAILLLTNIFLSIIYRSGWLLFPDFCIEHRMTVPLVFSTLKTVIYITGLFLLANGCGINRKLRRFIKWYPFIDGIAAGIWSMLLMEYIDAWGISPGIQFTCCEQIVPTILSFVFLFIVQHLSGIRVSKRE